jgi:metacaspase-1
MSFYPGQGFSGAAPHRNNGYPPQSYSPVPPQPGYPPQQGYGPPGPAYGAGYGAPPPPQQAPYGYNVGLMASQQCSTNSCLQNPPPQPQGGYGYGPPQQPNGYPGPRPGVPTMNSNPYVHGNAQAPRPPPAAPQSFGNGAPGAYSKSPPSKLLGQVPASDPEWIPEKSF